MFHLLKQTTETKVPVIRTFDDLKPHKNWVCYTRSNELVSPITRQSATNQHPATWSTYEQAHRYWYRNYPSIVGLNFMLTPEFGITIVELHHCLVDGKLNGFAQEMVETLDFYTETIYSGTGLRIWVQNAVPEHLSTDGESDEEGSTGTKKKVQAYCVSITSKEWGVR